MRIGCGSLSLALLLVPRLGIAAEQIGHESCDRDNAGSCANSMTTPRVTHGAARKDHLLMQLGHARVASAVEENSGRASCCVTCAGKPFCSPVSRNCYETKRKDYYQKCVHEERTPALSPSDDNDCCDSCESGRPGFCSPRSGNCYDSQAKSYYKTCPDGGLVRGERRLQAALPGASSIKLMSYNLFGWNAFNANEWRSASILSKIRSWKPAVLGAQEVETGGGHGGDVVSEKVTSTTGLTGGVGGSQFYDLEVLEAHETKSFDLVRGYWMSMTRFTHKASNVSFLFFNSHWKHGYASEQKAIIASAIHAERVKYNSPPTILVGDTNQFCQAHEGEAIRYLKGEIGSSPVTFVDAIAHDKGSSYTGGCRVDFILASAGQWQLVDSYIDREGMGGRSGTASDHAALLAELVPLAGEVSVDA